MKTVLMILALSLGMTSTAFSSEMAQCGNQANLTKLPGLNICMQNTPDGESACVCDGYSKGEGNTLPLVMSDDAGQQQQLVSK